MKVAGYICKKCGEPCDFEETDIREEYLCPKCGCKMWYLSSYEINENTGLTIGDEWFDEWREAKSPAPFSTPPQPTRPTITCPTCKSTNCKKISTLSKAGSAFMWGIFAMGKMSKQWHCNNCGSEF